MDDNERGWLFGGNGLGLRQEREIDHLPVGRFVDNVGKCLLCWMFDYGRWFGYAGGTNDGHNSLGAGQSGGHRGGSGWSSVTAFLDLFEDCIEFAKLL